MSTNIEDLFVPYKEAIALKELGFNEPCLKLWDGIGHHFDQKDWFDWNQSKNFVSIPLYQQAFKWFRDKHNLRYKFEPSRENTVDIFIWTDIGWEYFKNANEEKAELVCLRKLIQISKS